MDAKEPREGDSLSSRSINPILRILSIVALPLILLLMIAHTLVVIDLNIASRKFLGLPWVTTPPIIVKRMIRLANVKPGARAVDIGSGDGRLVIALAQAGAEAHGYEINPFLVSLSEQKIRGARLTGKAFIHRKSFWDEDLSGFDIVTVYGVPQIMGRLEEKLKRELKTDARIVSNRYTFPTWPPSKKEDNVYLYEQRANRKSQ